VSIFEDLFKNSNQTTQLVVKQHVNSFSRANEMHTVELAKTALIQALETF
jgi:hypothetical protein